MPRSSNLSGTHSDEFYLGKGDIDDPGADVIGVRTNGSGEAEYKEAGGVWQPFGSGAGFDVDTILTSAAGEVLVNQDGNVLVTG